MPTDLYWRRKLSAYLHDSPEKVLSLLDHESRARRIACEIDPSERSRKEADWDASAADRLPFPPSSETLTPVSCFRHPLGGSQVPVDEQNLPVGLAEETSQTTRPNFEQEDPRVEFIATWRFWRNWAASRRADFALYPAETRLPDHTIWNHLAVTSAMQGCLAGQPWSRVNPIPPADKPAFLLFTIGPVQDFIAEARSTRDLWSGSYLLSYLIGRTLSRIALDFGADHVIFPNLCDQPIIDLLLREELWNKVTTANGGNVFDALNYIGSIDGAQRLLTPSLPNRFLAVLPVAMAEHQDRGPQFQSVSAYAEHLASDLRAFLKQAIAAPVSKAAGDAFGDRFEKARFDRQVENMVEIHWQVTPWPKSFAEAETLANALPADDPKEEYTPRAGLLTIRDLCGHGADPRYLVNGDPKNVASAWSAMYSVTEWLLDGVKRNRAFRPTGSSYKEPSKTNSKDSLNGREEAVLSVADERDAQELSDAAKNKLHKAHLLKSGEHLGASTLIKRLWPYAVLCAEDKLRKHLCMPNTRSIAAHEPWNDDESEDATEEKYFAVLAVDGDSMGKWISGSKTPELTNVLSEECKRAFEEGANLKNRRPLSPAWHLQFSEALGNFSQHAARRIVEAFDGRLIYSGGDDVLAMLPADTALRCAEALRLAFRGDPQLNSAARGKQKEYMEDGRTIRRSDCTTPLFQIETPGFLQLHPSASDRHGSTSGFLDDPVNFPVIVPGPNADCSAGIAIAHFTSPLQDVVRAARQAENRAKDVSGKAAMAVSLLKRSGEITEWTCKWDSGGLKALAAIIEAIQSGVVSSKFPHRLIELVQSYQTDRPGQLGGTTPTEGFASVALEILEREIHTVADRQRGRNFTPEKANLIAKVILEYLDSSFVGNAQEKISALVGLCQTAAFIERNLPKGRQA
jgi:CRISPR-associated protein Cmr2